MRAKFTCLFLFASIIVQAQSANVSGIVLDQEGEPLVGAIVLQKGTTNAAYTDVDGKFKLTIKETPTFLVFTMLGFHKQEVELASVQSGEISIVMEEDSKTLDAVEIVGKSEVRKIQESGYNAVAIDMRPFHNSSIGLSQVLDQIPGVKIQQAGGLGSRTDVTINGLSGRHVRFFVDGMPMDAMGSAFQVNNIPPNLVERTETYKGVVPINFGSDALGGAINFVTKKTPGKYLDLSYSYGSFNTHLTFLNTGVTTDNGFTAQISAYQNYSDNDYYVDAKIKDFETNLLSKETKRVRRFHDKYHNEAVIAKVGVVDKSFADQLLFGFTLGQVYDEIQHAAYMDVVYGKKYYTSTLIMPSFLYSKQNLFIKGLDVSLAANYNFGNGHSVDVSDREYNWLGEYNENNQNPTPGEASYSDYLYDENNGTINANINYQIKEGQRLTLNNVTNLYSRQGDERKAVDDYINQKPRVNNRNILGLGWTSEWSKKFSTSVFAKRYQYYASAYIDLGTNHETNFQTVSRSDKKYGYGLTATYFLLENLQVKANYELTTRLPESTELFGETFGIYYANYGLEAEQSDNVNFGFIYTYKINDHHVLSTDVNLFYRYTSNFINQVTDTQGNAIYQNIHLVRTPGIDGELRYSFKNRFTAKASVSYLQPKNWNENSTFYKGVVPNQPVFFGNFNAAYFWDTPWVKDSRLSISYNLQFIDSFLLEYDTYNARDQATVDQQWNHSAFITYSWQNGKYNASVDCKNLLDANLYDNYSLQKPGRSFSVKFRYFFNKL